MTIHYHQVSSSWESPLIVFLVCYFHLCLEHDHCSHCNTYNMRRPQFSRRVLLDWSCICYCHDCRRSRLDKILRYMGSQANFADGCRSLFRWLYDLRPIDQYGYAHHSSCSPGCFWRRCGLPSFCCHLRHVQYEV